MAAGDELNEDMGAGRKLDRFEGEESEALATAPLRSLVKTSAKRCAFVTRFALRSRRSAKSFVQARSESDIMSKADSLSMAVIGKGAHKVSSSSSARYLSCSRQAHRGKFRALLIFSLPTILSFFPKLRLNHGPRRRSCHLGNNRAVFRDGNSAATPED